jgi:hypothetical protein
VREIAFARKASKSSGLLIFRPGLGKALVLQELSALNAMSNATRVLVTIQRLPVSRCLKDLLEIFVVVVFIKSTIGRRLGKMLKIRFAGASTFILARTSFTTSLWMPQPRRRIISFKRNSLEPLTYKTKRATTLKRLASSL